MRTLNSNFVKHVAPQLNLREFNSSSYLFDLILIIECCTIKRDKKSLLLCDKNMLKSFSHQLQKLLQIDPLIISYQEKVCLLFYSSLP